MTQCHGRVDRGHPDEQFGLVIEAAGTAGAVERALSLARRRGGLLRAGQIRPAPNVTHRFPLEAYDQAYQVLHAGSGRRGKVMLEVGTS